MKIINEFTEAVFITAVVSTTFEMSGDCRPGEDLPPFVSWERWTSGGSTPGRRQPQFPGEAVSHPAIPFLIRCTAEMARVVSRCRAGAHPASGGDNHGGYGRQCLTCWRWKQVGPWAMRRCGLGQPRTGRGPGAHSGRQAGPESLRQLGRGRAVRGGGMRMTGTAVMQERTRGLCHQFKPPTIEGQISVPPYRHRPRQHPGYLPEGAGGSRKPPRSAHLPPMLRIQVALG